MALHTRRTGNAEYGRFIKTLICGDPGSGKTLISSTFPNPYYVSAEGGLMSIAGLALPYLELEHSDQLFELRAALALSPEGREVMLGCPVETVIIDTIDEVQGTLIRERLEAERRDKMTLQDFGWLNEQMQSIIRSFRNLNVNVVFTCHLKETRDDELGRIVYRPGMQGQIAEKIPGFVDLSLLLTSHVRTEVVGTEPKPVVHRTLQTYADSQHPWIKDRSGKLPPEFEVNFADDYQRMYDLIFKGVDKGESVDVTPQPVVPPKKDTSVPAVPEAAAVEVPVETGQASTFQCDSCGTTFDDSDQAELSKIRLRKILCKPCYATAKPTK